MTFQSNNKKKRAEGHGRSCVAPQSPSDTCQSTVVQVAELSAFLSRCRTTSSLDLNALIPAATRTEEIRQN